MSPVLTGIREFLAERLSVSYFSVPPKYPAREWPSLHTSGHVSSLRLLLETLLVTVVRLMQSSTLSLSLWHSDAPTCLTALSPKRREPLTLGGSFDPPHLGRCRRSTLGSPRLTQSSKPNSERSCWSQSGSGCRHQHTVVQTEAVSRPTASNGRSVTCTETMPWLPGQQISIRYDSS